MTDPDLPPHVLAAADQGLATADASLKQLILRWKYFAPMYEADGLDRVHKVLSFMASDVMHLQYLIYPILVVAVEKLAVDE
jgi:hypothetical protein